MEFEEFLSHFKGIKRTGSDTAMVLCPHHADKNPSLSIKREGNTILMHDFGGCGTKDILCDVGLKVSDLMIDPGTWLDGVERWLKKRPEAIYDYHSLDQTYAYTKLRFPGKDFMIGIIDGDRFISGLGGKKQKDFKAVYGNQREIKKAIDDGRPVFIVEGEKDVNTLEARGYAAFTYGSAKESCSWSKDLGELCRDGNVYILEDNDEDGRHIANIVRNDLQGVAANVKIVNLTPGIEKGDVSDYFAAGHSVQEFEAALEETPDDEAAASDLKKDSDLSLIRADELQEMKLEPIKFIVDGMIVAGLTIIASEPKFGKSWMVLQLCLSVASGKDFLGFKTHQCGALYLALEDSYNRLQSRMERMLNGKEAPHELSIAIRASDLGDGLLDQLESYCRENPNTGLIVIDTFQRVRPSSVRNESMYAVDYREVGQLKQFADDHGIAIVLVHHTRKMKDPSDAFMNISGSMGITGAADTMIVLSKDQRTDETTLMSITGRDVEMQELEMAFQKSKCCWKILGTADEVEEQRIREEYEKDPIVSTVKKLLDQNAGIWEGSASELIVSSRYLGTPIHDTALKIGKSLAKLSDQFWNYDNIIYEPIKNGTGARKHKFHYAENPFDVTDNTVDTVESVDDSLLPLETVG